MRASSVMVCAVALLALVSCVAAADFPTALEVIPCSTGNPLFAVSSVAAPNVSLSLGSSYQLRLRGVWANASAVAHGPYSLLVERDIAENRPVTWNMPADLLFNLLGNDASKVLSAPHAVLNSTSQEVDSLLTLTLPADVPVDHNDATVLLRFEAHDDASNELVCVVVRVPVSHGAEDEAKTNKLLGYAMTFVAVIFFGTNFLPVKAYDTGDGVFFQWMMCFGVWLTGLVLQMFRKSAFEPFAMLGGVMWCIGNMTAVPVIQLIGLGVGMCLWGSMNLLAGWAAGRFGLLGINKQPVDNQVLNIVGLLICVASIAIMVQVKSVKEEKEAASQGSLDQALLVGEQHSDAMSVTGGLVQEPVEETWVNKLSPGSRRVVGVVLALCAGCLYGLNFNPPQHLIDSHQGASSKGIDYAFSHFCGILLTSTVYMVGYSLYKRNKPWVSAQIVVPGLLSGVGWAIAQISMFIANDQIKFVGTFPIASTCPGILASLCAIVFYKEIQGKRNYLFLGAAMCVTIVGVTLIALSLPKN